MKNEMTMVLDDETFPLSPIAFFSLCPQVGSYMLDVLRRLFRSFTVECQTVLPEAKQI